MLFPLVLLFVVVPIAELYVIIQVGQAIGALWTILLLIADSLIGARLLSWQGRRAWGSFQQALAELRTDLDAFTPDESHALMACVYQMAAWAFQRDISSLTELWDDPEKVAWPFEAMLEEITSTAATTPRRDSLLAALRAGSAVRL